MPLPHGTLATGRYRTVNFAVPFAFSVSGGMDGWAAVADERRRLELHANRNAGDGLLFALPSGYLKPGDSLVESLRAQAVTIDALRQVTVGGQLVEEFSFIVPGDAKYIQVPGVLIFAQGGGLENAWVEPPGSHVHIWLQSRGDADLVIVADAPSQKEFDAVSSLVDNLLATLTFE